VAHNRLICRQRVGNSSHAPPTAPLKPDSLAVFANSRPHIGKDFGVPHSFHDGSDICASRRDPSRFATVFDRHVDAVHGFLARRSGRQSADDLLGEVFCVAFERRATFDVTRDDARPWLYGIAFNLLRHTWRSAERRDHALARAMNEAATATDAGTSPEERAVTGERLDRLVTALLELPEVDRETLLLHAWEHLRYDDVAAVLDVPVGTVRSRISRARARLRELVADTGQYPDDDRLSETDDLATTAEGTNP